MSDLLAALDAHTRQIVRDELGRAINKLDVAAGPALMPRRDAADYLGISGSQLDRIYESGELDVVNGVGRGRLYTRESLDRFWRRRTEPGPAQAGEVRRLAG